MNQKENLKEKFKQALFSTIKVISDNYKLDKKENKNLSSKNFDFFEFDNLNKKEDYIKLRACLNFSFKLKSLLFIYICILTKDSGNSSPKHL